MKKPSLYCICVVENDPMYNLWRFRAVRSFQVRQRIGYLCGLESDCAADYFKKWRWFKTCLATARKIFLNKTTVKAVCIFRVADGALLAFVHGSMFAVRTSYEPKELHFLLRKEEQSHLLEKIADFQAHLCVEYGNHEEEE